MNGDSLLDIFYDMINFRFLMGMSYLMIFTFCGIMYLILILTLLSYRIV